MTTVARTVLHARLRWLGAPLLLTGVAAVIGAVFYIAGTGEWFVFALAAFGAGLGLASFGANHDTAMALGYSVLDSGGLPPGLRAELDRELARDRAAIIALRAAPRISLVIPLIAILIQAYVWWTLLGGLT